MMVVSTSKLFLLALFSVAGTANAKLKVEVTPVNSYAMEYSSLKITCTAYDEANVEMPESIQFIEVDNIFNVKNLNDKYSNLNFTTTQEDNGGKLIVTMTILNVTEKYESKRDHSYRCVAYAVNISKPAQFVFYIYVIQESDIPKVTVSKLTVDHSVSATIFCNITFRGSQTTTLKSLWLSKDGENLTDTLVKDGISEFTSLVLGDISMKDGGMYSCNLKVLLKGKVLREVKETTSLTIKPWFESKDGKTLAKKLGDDLTLECGARGYPLKVEWKFKSETDETVKTCIDSLMDKRYKVSQKGPHDPYSLTITSLSKADLGVYYCCLSSGCSKNINEEQCQSFDIDQKKCPSLAASIENGYKHGRGSVEGSLVWFSCANGYSLEGNKYLYCDENGQWNGTTPSCLKDCPQMNRTLENGHIDGNGYTSGAVYSFLCDEGYSIDGETSLRCDEKGQWNGSIPACLKARTDKEERDTNGWYLYVLIGAAVLILIIAIGLLVICCLRKSGKKDTATAKGDGEAELEAIIKP